MKNTFYIAAFVTCLQVCTIGCKQEPKTTPDNDLKKLVFVNGWLKGFIAAQKLVLETGKLDREGRDMYLVSDSVEFAKYIDSK